MSKLFCFIVLAVIGIVSCQDCKYGNLILKPGQSGSPKGECIRVNCISGSQISALPCPQIGIPHGCKVIYRGEDKSKPYPQCCPAAYCEK